MSQDSEKRTLITKVGRREKLADQWGCLVMSGIRGKLERILPLEHKYNHRPTNYG